MNDGSTTNVWSGDRYPAYIDIDLEKNYNLDEIQVFTPSTGYSQYSIYTSMDGRDFDKLAEKQVKKAVRQTVKNTLLMEKKQELFVYIWNISRLRKSL